MLQDEWITVERVQVEFVAEMMRSRLEAEGVEAVLRGNRASGTVGIVNELNISWDNPLGGVEVRVRQHDEQQAREILAESRGSKLPPRAMPLWLRLCAAFWFASIVFYCALAVPQNTIWGIAVGGIAFSIIFALGHRHE